MIAPSFNERTCKVCGKGFIAIRMAAVCSPKCAHQHVKNLRAKEKEETKARKAAIKTIPELLKEAQIAFNAYIRARDRDQPCISCGKPPPDLSELHAGRDAGHYRSVGSAPHLRFHEANCHAQCVKCNQWKAGNAVDYRIGLVSRIGVDRVDALESDSHVHKWTREELISIRDTYRAKAKALKEAA